MVAARVRDAVSTTGLPPSPELLLGFVGNEEGLSLVLIFALILSTSTNFNGIQTEINDISQSLYCKRCRECGLLLN